MSNTTNDRDREKTRKKRSAKTTAAASSGNRKAGSHTTGSGRTGRKQKAAGPEMNRNLVLIIILSVIVVIAVVAGVVVNLGKTSSDTPYDPGNADSSVDVVENANNLELNKYPEVNQLIANYRQGVKDADTDLLKDVFNTDEEINVDVLTATSQIIQDYKNTQCYTKRGLNSGEYVVFVYDELQLADIETLAPNLSLFYVKTAEDGSLYIYQGEYSSSAGTEKYDEATQAYINQLYQDEDLSELISAVNTKMDSACANDSDLMEFMEKVRSKTSVTPAVSETETETESETETEIGSETDAEA